MVMKTMYQTNLAREARLWVTFGAKNVPAARQKELQIFGRWTDEAAVAVNPICHTIKPFYGRCTYSAQAS